MLAHLFAVALVALCAALPARAETLQWAGGGRDGGFLGVLHHGIRGSARNGDTVWMTGTYDRFVSRYVALDWAVGRDRPGQIRMDGFGGLCLDAGNEPRRGAQVQVWECAGGGAVAGADARARAAQQTWVFAENQLRLAGTQLCVEVVEDDAAAAAEGNLRLEGCKGSRFAQWWRLKDASRSFTVQGPLWV